MVDILRGPLGGAAWSARISDSRGADIAAGIDHDFMAWRIDAFRERGAFFADIENMVTQVRATPVAHGGDPAVMIPSSRPKPTTHATGSLSDSRS